MNAGILRHLLVIQEKTETQSRSGMVEEEWAAASFSPVWGGYEPTTAGNEEFRVNKRHSEADAIFRIRYQSALATDPDATGKYRIIHRGKTWNILNIVEMGGIPVELQLEASQVR